jgi:hypothetical protein
MRKFIIFLLLVLLVSSSVSATCSWYNNSYPYRLPLNTTAITTGVPILVNASTNCFKINGYKQCVWTLPTGGDCDSVYFINSTNYIIASNTTALSFEVEGGNRSSSDTTGVWPNHRALYHGGMDSSASIAYDTMSTYNLDVVPGSNPTYSTSVSGSIYGSYFITYHSTTTYCLCYVGAINNDNTGTVVLISKRNTGELDNAYDLVFTLGYSSQSSRNQLRFGTYTLAYPTRTYNSIYEMDGAGTSNAVYGNTTSTNNAWRMNFIQSNGSVWKIWSGTTSQNIVIKYGSNNGAWFNDVSDSHL